MYDAEDTGPEQVRSLSSVTASLSSSWAFAEFQFGSFPDQLQLLPGQGPQPAVTNS
jgi:hypothetical protein